MIALMFMPHDDPNGDHRDETDNEGGGGDERRSREPPRRGGTVMIRTSVFTSGVLGNFRRGIELLVEQPVPAGVATRWRGDGRGGRRDHFPNFWVRIALSAEVGGAPLATFEVLGRVGLPPLLRHRLLYESLGFFGVLRRLNEYIVDFAGI